jgi:hypothetical protein
MEAKLVEVLEAGSVEVMEEVLVEAEQSVREDFHHPPQVRVEHTMVEVAVLLSWCKHACQY